jgi:predicted nuclease of predicted toxin-antitoxin system
MAAIALLLNEDVRPLLGEILRDRGYDVVHVAELNRDGLTDPEQLNFAASERRAILTYNVKDFVLLDKTYRETGKEHYGIVFSKQLSLKDLLRRALRFLNRHSRESVHNIVFWLPD